MLILTNGAPWHWLASGALLALITLSLLYVGRTRLGVSTGFENLCAQVLRVPYLRRPSLQASGRWRLPFIGGLVFGGVLSAALSGGWAPTWDLGLYDQTFGGGPLAKLSWMFGGGLLIGFGTRMASGCTSGHGIFGVANLERASLEATAAFLLSGIVTTHLIYRVLA